MTSPSSLFHHGVMSTRWTWRGKAEWTSQIEIGKLESRSPIQNRDPSNPNQNAQLESRFLMNSPLWSLRSLLPKSGLSPLDLTFPSIESHAIRKQTSFELKGREGAERPRGESGGRRTRRTAPFCCTCGADGEIEDGHLWRGNEWTPDTSAETRKGTRKAWLSRGVCPSVSSHTCSLSVRPFRDGAQLFSVRAVRYERTEPSDGTVRLFQLPCSHAYRTHIKFPPIKLNKGGKRR